jgi:hypothetical protein
MAIQTELFTLLGPIFSNRFFPNGAAEKPVAPYAVYSRISAVREQTLDTNGGTNNLVQTNLQIDIYAKTYAESISLADQVKTALNGWSRQNLVMMEQDFYEPDETLHRATVEISVWHR